MKRITIHRLVLIAIVALPAINVCGCNIPDKVATVSGTVTFQGKPMPGGTIIFLSEDRTKQEIAQIKADGTYTAERVPWGKVLVGVQPVAKPHKENKPPKDQGVARPQIEGQYVDIPQLLRSPATSTITFDVDMSPKSHDIRLPEK